MTITIRGLGASSRVFISAIISGIAVFVLSGKTMHRFFRSDTYWDDVCLGLVTAAIVIGFMYQRELKRRDIERRELKAFRATMSTVYDIVGNFLNAMQLVLIDGEGHLPPETLDLVQGSITTTQDQLAALANLERFSTKSTAIGTGVDYQPIPKSQSTRRAMIH